MSVEPVWCLLRIEPEDFSEIQQVFEDTVARAKSAGSLQKYLQRRERHARLLKKRLSEFPFFGVAQSVTLTEYLDDAELFLDAVDDLFYLPDHDHLLSLLFRQYTVSWDALIEMVVTRHRVATQILFGALGWQTANRLPGYFGNMVIAPQAVATVLTHVEEIFSEVNAEAFSKRARAIAVCGVVNEDRIADSLIPLLLSALKLASQEDCGFAAISHPHLGCLPMELEP